MFVYPRNKSIGFLGLLWTVWVCASEAEENLPSAMDLQRTYVAANGGFANLQALSSLVTYGVITGADGTESNFKMYKKRPGMTRIQIDLPQGFMLRVFDGNRGFEVVSRRGKEDQVEDLGAAESEKMRLDSSMDGPFFQLRSRPEWLEVVAETVVNEEPAYEIKVDEAANSPYDRIWLDQENCQEVKLRRRLGLGEDGEWVVEEIYFSDFEQINGVWFAKSSRYERGGNLFQRIRIERMRANVGIFDSLFQRPKP